MKMYVFPMIRINVRNNIKDWLPNSTWSEITSLLMKMKTFASLTPLFDNNFFFSCWVFAAFTMGLEKFLDVSMPTPHSHLSWIRLTHSMLCNRRSSQQALTDGFKTFRLPPSSSTSLNHPATSKPYFLKWCPCKCVLLYSPHFLPVLPLGFWLCLIPKFIVVLLEQAPVLPTLSLQLSEFSWLWLFKSARFYCLTCIQAISRRFLLSVSSQCFGLSSYFPEDCINQQVVLPKTQTLKCYFTYFFILLPFFCNLSFCSLSSTLKLTFILFFYGPVSLLLGTCPCTDCSGFTQLLLFCLCQPQLSSLQALSSLPSWSFHISPVPCSFLLETISDMVKLLEEKQSPWAVEECVCVCIACLFFSTFPIQIISSSEVSYLWSAQHTQAQQKHIKSCICPEPLGFGSRTVLWSCGSSPQQCTKLFTT